MAFSESLGGGGGARLHFFRQDAPPPHSNPPSRPGVEGAPSRIAPVDQGYFGNFWVFFLESTMRNGASHSKIPSRPSHFGPPIRILPPVQGWDEFLEVFQLRSSLFRVFFRILPPLQGYRTMLGECLWFLSNFSLYECLTWWIHSLYERFQASIRKLGVVQVFLTRTRHWSPFHSNFSTLPKVCDGIFEWEGDFHPSIQFLPFYQGW